MRVIAGKAKHLQLKTPKGMETRPTTDRIKETLFNIIQHDIYDSIFLDLFSGSGGIGIEALSRGASKAYFVEYNRRTADIIKDNLKTTHLEDNAVVIRSSAVDAVRSLSGKEKFNIVFMDPPYNKSLELEVLNVPEFHNILDDDAIVIVEASLDTVISDDDIKGLYIEKEKLYKTNKHIFLRKLI